MIDNKEIMEFHKSNIARQNELEAARLQKSKAVQENNYNIRKRYYDAIC